MSDAAEQEFNVADFCAFTPTGPTLLFIRARRSLSAIEQDGALQFMQQMKWPPNVQCVWLAHDFDVFAVGDAEMRKIGWMPIPEASEAAS